MRLAKGGAESAAAHLRYISRTRGANQDQPALSAYDADTDDADLKGFHERATGTRHQFRFIVSPEDATELRDLRSFTRHLMDRVASDLETRLDWVAVDHWDTDNPHTHIVLSGRDGSGKDLVIAGEYIAKGIRTRASEIASSWLGPRTDSELRASLQREVGADRWTSLDMQLKGRIRDGRVDLTVDTREPGSLRLRTYLIGRLNHLQVLGLARLDDDGHWQLRRDAEDTLRSLGERGDIVRTMQRTFGRVRRELSIFDPAAATDAIVGRIADKGLVDELGDKAFVIVDGIDGRGHYVKLSSVSKLADLPLGGVLKVGRTAERSVDRNIVAACVTGVYVPRSHEHALCATYADRQLAKDVVAGHVRRLEALRRAGIVERISDGTWEVPADLVDRGMEYDRRRTGGMKLELVCHLPIERQVRAIGATWLDELLVEGQQPGGVGYGTIAREAMVLRKQFLVEQGMLTHSESHSPVARTLRSRLRHRELEAVARAMARESGLVYRPVSEGAITRGVYQRPVQLVSGRFALLSDGLGFSLVPWRPVIERELGNHLSAVVRGDHVTWHLGRSRVQSIG